MYALRHQFSHLLSQVSRLLLSQSYQFSHLLSQTFYHCSTCLIPAASLTLTLLTPCEYQPIHLCCSSVHSVKTVSVSPHHLIHQSCSFNHERGSYYQICTQLPTNGSWMITHLLGPTWLGPRQGACISREGQG